MTVPKTAPKAAAKKKPSTDVTKAQVDASRGGADLETRLTAVEEKVGFLMKERPGRKYLPVVAKEKGVCGVDPSRDSKTCQDASLWRRNNGCLGDACVAESTKYYKNYREKNKAPVVVAAPKKRTRKKG